MTAAAPAGARTKPRLPEDGAGQHAVPRISRPDTSANQANIRRTSIATCTSSTEWPLRGRVHWLSGVVAQRLLVQQDHDLAEARRPGGAGCGEEGGREGRCIAAAWPSRTRRQEVEHAFRHRPMANRRCTTNLADDDKASPSPHGPQRLRRQGMKMGISTCADGSNYAT